jgi:hypothetical protein
VVAPLVLSSFLVTLGCADEAPPGSSPDATDTGSSAASAAPQGTDIWLLELSRDGNALRATSPRNLTQRPGYDNQPFFTPSGDILYVQMQGERTDVWRWNAETERVTQVTATPDDSEFSPTSIPGGDGDISYIHAQTDSNGRLWRMSADGSASEAIFADIVPVGYHAWFDEDFVALWRLQEPSLLQLVEVDSQNARTLASGVGRSPQSVPNRRAVSYARAVDEGMAYELYDLDSDTMEVVARLPEGDDFHAWTPDGTLLASAGSRVLAWREGTWQEVVDLAAQGLLVSRLAVSADGSRLALVAEPAP